MAGKSGKQVYRTRRWQLVRLKVFERDGWKCVRCGRRGRLECDHIRQVAKAGDWFAMDNLRTVCRTCHIELTAEENRKPRDPDRAALLKMAMQCRD